MPLPWPLLPAARAPSLCAPTPAPVAQDSWATNNKQDASMTEQLLAVDGLCPGSSTMQTIRDRSTHPPPPVRAPGSWRPATILAQHTLFAAIADLQEPTFPNQSGGGPDSAAFQVCHPVMVNYRCTAQTPHMHVIQQVRSTVAVSPKLMVLLSIRSLIARAPGLVSSPLVGCNPASIAT